MMISNEACDKLNALEKQRLADLDKEPMESYKFPYDTPPYYVGKHDVTKFVRSSRERTPETVFKRYPEWIAIYQVPSVGEFLLVPKSGTAIEEYKIDYVDYEQ